MFGPTQFGSRRSTIVRSTLIAAIVGLGVGIFAGCGSSDTPLAASVSSMPNMSMPTPAALPSASMAASDQAQTTAMIHISGFKFITPAAVSPGATVTVMNMDGEAHTVTADSGSAFDMKAAPSQIATFTAPSKPGTYKFHCTYHSNMHGELVVE